MISIGAISRAAPEVILAQIITAGSFSVPFGTVPA
jgi:hypothetical protein